MQEDSKLSGSTKPPLLEYTIGQALDLAALAWPDDEALVSVQQSARLTWSQLRKRSDEFAAGLVALRLDVGDRVGIWAPNCAEWTITQLATARAGLILVNINPAYRVSELRYTLNKVGIRALVCAARFRTSDYIAMVEDIAPEIALSATGRHKIGQVPSLRAVIHLDKQPIPGWLRFDDVPDLAGDADRAQLSSRALRLDRNDPINIQFSSGTTGLPKGATLSSQYSQQCLFCRVGHGTASR